MADAEDAQDSDPTLWRGVWKQRRNVTSITSIREAAAHFLPVVGARDTMPLAALGEKPQFGSISAGHAEPHGLFA